MSNPYDALFADEAKDSNPYADSFREDALRQAATLRQAAQLTPQQHAQTLDTARRANLPPEVVARNPDVSALVAQRDREQIVQRYPALGEFLLQSPGTAGLLLNDLHRLGPLTESPLFKKPTAADFPITKKRGFVQAGQELMAAEHAHAAQVENYLRGANDYRIAPQLSEYFGSYGKGAINLFGGEISGVGALLDIAQRNAVGAFADLFLPTPTGGGKPTPESLMGHSIGADWMRVGQGIKNYGSAMGAPKQRATLGTDVLEGIGQLGGQIAQYAIAGPGAFIPGMYAQGADQMAHAVAGDQASQGAKDAAIVLGGAITPLTEKFGIDALLNRIPPNIKANAWRRAADVLMAGGIEAFQEYTEQLGQDITQKLLTDPNHKLMEGAGHQATVAGLSAALVRALLGVKGGPLDHAVTARAEAQARAETAVRGANALREAGQAIAQTEAVNLGEQGRAALAQVLNQSAPDAEISIAAADLRDTLGGDLDTVLVTAPRLRAQYMNAIQIGGDLILPTGDFLATFAQSPVFEGLLEHVRTDPGAATLAEARAFAAEGDAQLKADFERLLSERHGDDTFKASGEAVKAQILAELNALGRFTAAKNEADATLTSSYYTVRAAQLGITPEEMYQRHRLAFAAERIDGAQFDQALASALPKGWVSGDGRTAADLWAGKSDAVAVLMGQSSGKIVDEIPGAAGYSHSISRFAIRHIQKNRGNAAVESARNQIAITDADIAAVADIPASYDAVRTDLKSRRGLPVVAYAKRVDDGVLLYLEEINKKRRDMAAISLWKYPAATDVQQILQSAVSSPNVQNDGGHTLDLSDGWRAFNQGGNLGTFNPDTNTITLLKNANLSTFLHEGAHFFFENDIRLALRLVGIDEITPGEQQILDDVHKLMDWHGIQGDIHEQLRQWDGMGFEERRAYHEQTARSFEVYLYEGKPPSVELAPYFQRFRAWLLNVYKRILEAVKGDLAKGLDSRINDEVRGVFDRMLATNEQIALAEQGRSMIPLFASPDQAGMTPEEFAAYQAIGVDATNEAIQELQARGLRDMQWMHNARGRVIARLKREARAQRADVMIDARREIMSQPIYQAWQFLTGKMGPDDKLQPPEKRASSPDEVDSTQDTLFAAIAKLGGIQRAQVESEWGFYKGEKSPMPTFGNYVLRRDGGMTIDGMAELLSQHGYLVLDKHGKWDLHDFEEKFGEEYRGRPVHSAYHLPEPETPKAGEQVARSEGIQAGRLDLASLREMYTASSPEVERAKPVRQADTFDKAKQAAQAFVGRPLTNTATGKQSTVSNGTLGKMLSEKAARKSISHADHALAVANIDHLFAHALLDHSHPDKNGEPTIAAIHRFMSPMIGADGGLLLVKMTVKETTGTKQPNPLYTVEAIDVEKPAWKVPPEGGIEWGTGTDGVAATPTSGLNPSVAALLNRIKHDIAAYGHGTRLVDRMKALGMAGANAWHPDLIAEKFGYTSGDELVRALAATETPHDAINALTDVRMLEQFGDLSSPEAIEKAADKAIHNDARARFVATEANALAKATGQRKVLASAAREYASALISRLKVRDIKPGQYANAEVRAAKAAEKASKAGDLAAAAAEKRNQLIQNYATRAAYNAQEEVDKGLRYLKKFEGDIKSLDADYADQIGNLLERFDLRKGQSNKAVDKRTALAAWLEKQREEGREPDIPEQLKNEAFRTSYKNLTVEEFRGVIATVEQLEHIGRTKSKLLTAKKQREYTAVRDEIVASIHQHAQGREADTRTPTTNMGRAVQGLKRFWAAHIKAATWARVMDGGKDGGPMWEYFVRIANERGDQETTMRAEATTKLSEILAPVFKLGRMGGKGQFFPTINRSLNREACIAIALNIGNDGNLQRLLGGEGWTMAQLAPVLQSLTAQEWQAVQAVWDHFEGYRPHIAAKEHRVYGKEPEWVTPRPFAVTTADGTTVQMRGGYYPIKYDPAASQRAEEHADAESAKRQLQGAYTTATTRRSFTKSRVEEVQGRPLLYTLGGLYSGVNDVIHDLAWHEWLIDANRLLRSHTIDAAIRDHYGPEAKQQFKTWVQDVAEGDKGAEAAFDTFSAWTRRSVSLTGLGFNVMSAAVQPVGITQSIVRVGAPWVARGMRKYLAHPLELMREVNEMSSFMASRSRTRFRELAELRNRVEDQTAFKEFVGRYGYWLMMRFQQMVDVPTWWGAYEKAIAEGNDETRAIALADQAVIDAQGSGQTKDLSAIERGGPTQKLFTVFYSFMNTALNMGVTQTMSASTPAKRVKLASDYLLLYVAPAMMVYALRNAITPGDSGDDDPEKIAKKLLAAQLDYLMGLMVGVREFGEAIKMMTGANDFGRPYSGPAGLRIVPDTVNLATQAHQGEVDVALLKSMMNVTGDLFGLPSAQINRIVTGTKALVEGKTENPAAIAFGFQEKR